MKVDQNNETPETNETWNLLLQEFADDWKAISVALMEYSARLEIQRNEAIQKIKPE